MAEQSFHDVVDQSQSVGDSSPADVLAKHTTNSAARAALGETTAALDSGDNVNRYDSTTTGNHPANEGVMEVGGSGDTNPLVNGIVGVNDTHAHASAPDEGSFVNGMKESDDGRYETEQEAFTGQTGIDGGVTSEPDSANKDPSDLQGNTRSNSFKKPATFKAVSVTKNFLAKASTTSNTASKGNNEKVTAAPSSSALQLGSRPRLVAKTVNGHRGSAPKSLNMGSRAGRGSGPDPNQVWNRNRVAAPQATPKHLTDEELKQQYGIHLASRLQEDGEGKEAKWADIDDDEDDWIPETIEWNDGTKITLSQNEAPAVRTDDHTAALAAKQKEEEDEIEKSKLEPTKPTTTVGPNATVLKVGSAGQPKTGGLVLKAPSEKPTLVAKPSAPAPAKSPWAPLPPVEKISPIPTHPPTQPPSRFSQKDPHGFDAMPPPPSPAKEIAADDFTRSWRDNENSIPRELFNSQSGRYEPVGEGRRGSMRKDQGFRPPSVLQRPLHSDHGPAEPSPAFQTNRFGSQQEVGAWPRRRASSNLSGEGTNQGRRMSLGKTSELPRIPNESQQRHDSQRDQSPLAPEPASAKHGPREVSPARTHGSSSIMESPTLATTQQAGAPDTPVIEDPVAVQKKLMREKREMAIKRKKEEEEKELAEKKERIRLKLEKLGGPSVSSRKTQKEATAEASPRVTQGQTQQGQTQPPEISRSPPKPPVLDKSGEPKQYGMMKVHGPHVNNGFLPNGETHHKELSKSPRPSEKTLYKRISPKNEVADQLPASQVNGDGKKMESKPSAPASPELHQPEILPDSKQPSWKGVQNSTTGYAQWSSPSMTTHSSANSNVWGPPTHHRGIGNGTFDGNVQRPQSRQPSYQQSTVSPAPQPIAPPKIPQHTFGTQDLSNVANMPTRSGIEDAQTIPAFPSPEPLSLPPSNKTSDSKQTTGHRKSDQLHPTSLPRMQDVPDRPMRSEQPRSGVSAWANFPAQVAHDDMEQSLRVAQEQAAQRIREERTGIKQEIQLPPVNETWRQVKVNEQAGQRSIIGAQKTQNAAQNQPPILPIVEDLRSISLPKATHVSTAAGVGRSSRFFPPMGPGILAQNQRAASHTLGYNRPASPPPPDSTNHPAFSGANERPLVNLPIIKPKPTVKLPPSFKAPAPVAKAPETRTTSLRAVSQPLVNNPSWQDRFNNLFGVAKPSLEKSTVPTTHFSASKVPLELALVDDNAAVALPPSDDFTHGSNTESEAVTSKKIEDQDELFEERDFGSVPTVRIPANAPMAIWDPAKTPKVKRLRSKFFPEIQICSMDYFEFGLPDREASGFRIPIRFPGFLSTKFKVMPSVYGSIRPTQQLSSPNRKAGKPFKSRNSSASYGSSRQTKNEPAKPQTPNAQNSPGQQSRQKANNGQNWARRSSRVVH